MNRRPILVVEDEPDIRENMEMLLEDEGYLVYCATNGQEALEILRDPNKSLPGLVALDFFMPVMDARAFLQIVETEQQQRKLSNFTIVLVTAADAQSRAGIQGKVSAVLQKPINIEVFLKLVEAHCDATPDARA